MLGDLSGIRNYVLSPTPAAGAAGRVRARSFRVNAFAHLMVRRVQELAPGLTEVYTAGGRFLLTGPADAGAEKALSAYQAELDQWALANLRGEMMCHLAARTAGICTRGINFAHSPRWPSNPMISVSTPTSARPLPTQALRIDIGRSLRQGRRYRTEHRAGQK